MSDELAKQGEILAERERVRAILAPNGKDLEKVLIGLHLESAKSQRKSRRNTERLRAELMKRLDEGETLVIHGNEVVVEKVTNSDLIRQQEANANSVKVEAMAQRSYDVHRMTTGTQNPQAGSIESFIDQLEQEEQTEVPDDVPPDW